MKKVILTASAVIAYSLSWAQYNSPWTYTAPSTSSAGYVGIGTKNTNTATNTPVPNFNLHLHGTSDYSIEVIRPFPDGPLMQNQGKTTRIGLTNTTTGMTEADGAVIRMSDKNLYIQNREVGEFQLSAGSNSLIFSGINNRTWFGSDYGTIAECAKFNISGGTDNGLYVRVPSGKYGLSIRSGSLTDNAMQVMSTDGITESFSVKGNGSVGLFYNAASNTDKVLLIRNSDRRLLQLTNDGILRSREIIVDALTWSDYVFEPNYKLRSLDEVKAYIAENGHLPNVPSTAEVTENGVNLAKTDAILLEKIEELTLYILQLKEKNEQLEARLKVLETLK